MGAHGTPRAERVAFRAGAPVVGVALRRYLDIDEAPRRRRPLPRRRGLRRRRPLLGDGRRFLLGDRFTAADLTFAALAAPMLVPAGYGSPLPPIEAMPDDLADEVRRLRAHPAGVFADRLYAEERRARASR